MLALGVNTIGPLAKRRKSPANLLRLESDKKPHRV